MGWYIVKRIGQMIPVFFGATLLIYAMVFLTPGDPVAALAGDKPLTPELVKALRDQYHLNDPFIVQYGLYLKGIFTGDFGTTFSGRPVIDEISRAFPITVELALMALVIETVFGIGFGVIAGLKKAAGSTPPSWCSPSSSSPSPPSSSAS